MPPVVTTGTPLARRAAPAVKLDQQICLRCSKRVGEGGEDCQKDPLAKCEYCRRLKKDCSEVPVEFRKDVNRILRLFGSRLDEDGLENHDNIEALATAKRSYVKNVEAFLRKSVKHGLTKRPKGDEIQLLQVQAMGRIATALEGILDCLRASGGHAPLGDADAPTDNEDFDIESVIGGEDDEEDGEGEENEEEGGGLLGGGGLGELEEGAAVQESPTPGPSKQAGKKRKAKSPQPAVGTRRSRRLRVGSSEEL